MFVCCFPGLEFVLHLFDSARVTIESASSSLEAKSVQSSESNRVLEDRMMALEQDHRRLNKFVEWRAAIDSELADFHENVRYEDWFVIHGLDKIDEPDKKQWQLKAKADVNSVLSILMGKEYPIVVVQNITSKGKDAICRYQVLLPSVSDSKEIRDKFGSFFVGGKGDTRPEELKPFSIQNRITPGTQLRISILKLMARRYSASNPGGKAFVISYKPRAEIKIQPPEDASDRRIQTYHYVDAIKNLPVNFTQAELKPMLERINLKLRGSLHPIFIVVSDDMLPKFKPGKARGGSGAGGSGSGRPTGSGGSGSGRSTGSGGSGARADSRGRGSKRGPSVSPSDSAKSSKSSKNSKN